MMIESKGMCLGNRKNQAEYKNIIGMIKIFLIVCEHQCSSWHLSCTTKLFSFQYFTQNNSWCKHVVEQHYMKLKVNRRNIFKTQKNVSA